MSPSAPVSLAKLCSGFVSVVLVVACATFLTADGWPERPRAVLAIALLSLVPAVVWQLATNALTRVVGPSLGRLRARAGLDRFVSRDPAAPREPVVGLHAAILTAGLWLVLLAAAHRLLLLRLRSIEVTSLREQLSIVGVAALALVTLAIAAGARLGFLALIRRLDRRARLPLPPSPALRVLLWLALPLSALASLLLAALDSQLGVLSAPLWLLLVVGVQLALYALLSLWPIALRLRARWLGPSALLLAGAGVLGADLILSDSDKVALTLENANPSGLLLSGARALTDFDGDGASSLFGERDCAAFSAARGPLARDIPGNHIDENCDGKDDAPNSLPSAPKFYGGLRADQIADYDVVWFVIDAVRADHTSLLGYELPTTPNLEALAQESLVFTRAYSQSSATMLSIPSMITGIDPGELQWVKESRRLQVAKDQRRYLSDMLEERGYATGIVTVTYFKSRLPGLLSGYDWIGYANREHRDNSSSTAALASDFIARARQSPKPYMLFTYMAAPHHRYYRHSAGYPKFPKGEQGAYALEIVNADRHLGFVIDVLRADPERWQKTIVIVTADHGEEFKEHGKNFHAETCHVESLHVPLLVRVPGLAPARVDREVGLVDIVPTVLELVGAAGGSDDAPAAHDARDARKAKQLDSLDGSSLLLAAYSPDRIPKDRPLFCTVVNQKRGHENFARRSVQSGRWKLMTELRGSVQPRLYDVLADPREQSPLEPTGKRAELAERLSSWLSAQLTGNVHLIDMSQ